MMWRLFLLFARGAGWMLGPILIHSKEIRRVARYTGNGMYRYGTASMVILIVMAPLFGLVAQMSPQERRTFEDMEKRLRRVEVIVTKIDDPDGMLRTLNERTRALELKLSDADLARVRLEAKIDRNNEKLDDFKSDLWKWTGIVVAAVTAAFRLFDWIASKLHAVATTETGENTPIR